ncbi:MAG: DUF1194 domain-containing protein [Pseudomonadota bacterium]
MSSHPLSSVFGARCELGRRKTALITHWLAVTLLAVAASNTPTRAEVNLPQQALFPSCQLALVLALDVSASVDAEEFALQTDGLAAALDDPAVRETLQSFGPVLAVAYEWSGRYQQQIIAPWQMLDSENAIDGFRDQIRGHQRSFTEFPTAMGYALGFGAQLLKTAPEPCIRHVIDVSGDGVQNEGFGPSSAYKAFDFDQITVNGLVIRGSDPDPVDFYRSEVLHGPGAFLEIATDYGDYARAMRKKLMREITGAGLATVPGPASP